MVLIPACPEQDSFQGYDLMQQQQQNSYSTCKINNVDSIRTKYLCSMNYRDRCRITSRAANITAAGGVVVQTRLRLHRVVVIVVDDDEELQQQGLT